MRLVSYEKKEVYPPSSVKYALISLGEQILLKKKVKIMKIYWHRDIFITGQTSILINTEKFVFRVDLPPFLPLLIFLLIKLANIAFLGFMSRDT